MFYYLVIVFYDVVIYLNGFVILDFIIVFKMQKVIKNGLKEIKLMI